MAGATARLAADLADVNRLTAAQYFVNCARMIARKVHTLIVPNTKTATLAPLIRQPVKPESIAYTDGYTSYDLLDVSEFNHHRDQLFGKIRCGQHQSHHMKDVIDDIHHQRHKRYW